MLTVGQLARIFDVSSKTLRHYDAIGLFTPIKIGEDNRYRFYSPEQLPELRRILFLRSMGLGIEVIRELQRNGTLDDAEKVKLILLEHAEGIKDEIARGQKLLAEVQRMVDHISNTGGISMEPAFVMKTAFTVVGMEWSRSNSEGGIPELWGRFIPREHEIQGKLAPTVSYGVCICGSDSDAAFGYVAGFETDGTHVPPGMVAYTVPEQRYAVFTHTGPASRISETMELIYSKWLPFHGLEPSQGVDLEMYDERFLGPADESSQLDLYIPLKG